MSEVRTVALEQLERELRRTLGADSLLYRQLALAIRRRDADAVDRAMTLLARYPAEVRRAVEDAVLAWLFDARADEPAADTAASTS